MPTILIIDDEPTVRQLLRDILCDEGFAVIGVGDGVEGLVALRTVQVDLILCDIMMPRMNGIAFATRLRTDPRNSSIPLIMLSATPAENSLPATMYTAFLEKPFAVPALLNKVEQALDQAGSAGALPNAGGVMPRLEEILRHPVVSA